MKRVLVTGAAGFVGANLVRRLLSLGHDVYALIRPNSNTWRLSGVESDLILRSIHLEDEASVRDLVKETRPDWIFHLAAHGAYPSQRDLRQMISTNFVGTVNLVESCADEGFEVFVNTGSSSEYGLKESPTRETDDLQPNSFYAVTKAAGSLYCSFVGRSRGLRIVTLRLYSVFGPYEEPTRLIPVVLIHGFHGSLPPLVDPEISRDFVYTEDVEEAYLRAALAEEIESGEIFNVGSGSQTSLEEVVDVAREAFQLAEEPRWGSMNPRSWDTSTWVADIARIKERLDWEPRNTFKDGFKKFAHWLLNDQDLTAFYQKVQTSR